MRTGSRSSDSAIGFSRGIPAHWPRSCFVAGTWQLEQGRVVLEPFGKLPAAAKRELKDEAERLEAFLAS